MKFKKEQFISHRTILSNLSYMSLLQIFLLLAPLITYPYLVRILGKELYGAVLTAQMLVSYASVLIDFGSNDVCAKHVSLNRDNQQELSKIVNSVIVLRLIIWTICFFIYAAIVYAVPAYNDYFLLFILSYGMSCNEMLFPQFFFQGIERMKYITVVSISTKVIFIILIFFLVKNAGDYLLVPVLYSIGYLFGGVISLHVVYRKLGLSFFFPSKKDMIYYFKDSSAIFSTNLISTIKDKINYLLVGSYLGMSSVVVYDLGYKLLVILSKPSNILATVMLPNLAKSKNVVALKKTIIISFLITSFCVFVANIFMSDIVSFFIGNRDDIDILPIRLFTIVPMILSISVIICNDYFIAFGYNKFALYSIIITTCGYLIVLGLLLMENYLSSVYSFILLSIFAYMIELLYRLFILIKASKRNG